MALELYCDGAVIDHTRQPITGLCDSCDQPAIVELKGWNGKNQYCDTCYDELHGFKQRYADDWA